MHQKEDREETEREINRQSIGCWNGEGVVFY